MALVLCSFDDREYHAVELRLDGTDAFFNRQEPVFADLALKARAESLLISRSSYAS